MERIRSAIQKAKEGRDAMLAEGGVQAPTHRRVGGASVATATAATASATEAAPSAWERAEAFRPNLELMDRNRVVTFDQKDAAHVPFDMMRTRVLAACRKNNWKTIGITSPTAACGKTVTSINLAFSFARQKDNRTVLMDVDLRKPRVAENLGIQTNHSMGQFLSGNERIEDHFLVYGQTLAIGTNKRRSLHSAEILQDAKAIESMATLHRALMPDVVIVDLPPMMAADDVIAFLPNLDAILIVVAAGTTQMREVDDTERELAERTNVMGIVLNKCEYMPDSYGYKYD